jgi:hypothetical protein
MFQASSCTTSGAYKLQYPPLVYHWNMVVAMSLVVVGPVVGNRSVLAGRYPSVVMWCTPPVYHGINLRSCDVHYRYITWPQIDTVLLTRSHSPQPDQPWPTTLLPPRSNGKPEAVTAVYKLMMMGMRMLKTCWAVLEYYTLSTYIICYTLEL